MTTKMLENVAKIVAPKLNKIHKGDGTKKSSQAIVNAVVKEAEKQTPKEQKPEFSTVHIIGKGYDATKAIMRIRKTLRHAKKNALADQFVAKAGKMTILTDVLKAADGFVLVK